MLSLMMLVFRACPAVQALDGAQIHLVVLLKAADVRLFLQLLGAPWNMSSLGALSGIIGAVQVWGMWCNPSIFLLLLSCTMKQCSRCQLSSCARSPGKSRDVCNTTIAPFILPAKHCWNFMMHHKCHYTQHTNQELVFVTTSRQEVGSVWEGESGSGRHQSDRCWCCFQEHLQLLTASLTGGVGRYQKLQKKKYLQRFYLFPEHIKNMTIQTSAPTTATQRKIQNKFLTHEKLLVPIRPLID